ncbi:hypothetical protein NE237_026224 [Protea cynaroides]|uniref:Uncharacterized protein n=1 Tax=Protea cynaroides TaxID=273540 RepID=A0A9Q0H3U6_9MAGN|nr:hypothetical protein NE237_026224 [Protea cynaroides]
MERKALLLVLLMLFLAGFSYVLSSTPLTPSPSAYLKSSNEDPSIQEFVEQGLMEGMRNYGEGLELDHQEPIIRGRMDIVENNDYAGTGANHRHDPKVPPSV